MSYNTNIQNVENAYIYESAQSNGVKAKSAVNSIHDVEDTTSSNPTQVEQKTKLDELLEKMCLELKEYGVSATKIMNSGILYRITGYNEQQLSQKTEVELKQIIACLQEAIKDSAVNGQVDLEKAGSLANDYYVAVKTGWTIESYKRNRNGESLDQRLERFFGLDKKDPPVKLSSLPQEKINEYVERYFHSYFEELKNKGMSSEEAHKKQLQDFGKLLINTPDEYKGIFKIAITSLVTKNQVKGLDAVLRSFDTPTARTAWADSWNTEDTKRLATNVDPEGNVNTQEDVADMISMITEVKSAEGIAEHQEALQKDAERFFEENKDALARIAEKEAKGEELTEEEKQLKLIRDNYIIAAKAGEMAGTTNNSVISVEQIAELLDKMNRDAYELPVYKDVLKGLNKYIENKNDGWNRDKSTIANLLDKSTNGNYSKVASGDETVELNAPAEIKVPTEAANADLGLPNRESVDTTRLQQLELEVKSTALPEDNNFVVVSQDAKNEAEQTEVADGTKSLLKQRATFFKSGDIKTYKEETGESSFRIAADIFMNFSDACQRTQDFATEYFSSASFSIQNLFMNKIANSLTAVKEAAKTGVDLSQFNTKFSVTTQKEIDKIQKQK